MKKTILFLGVLFLTVFIACDSKDDEQEEIAVTPTCTDGIQNGTETGVDCGGSCDACPTGIAWSPIATDAAGDAANNGLDATELSYQYDSTADLVRFRIKVTNLSPFGDSPSADFSFGLPNGTDNNDPTAYHWTDTNQESPVHLTAAIYCDTGGTPPSSYTYTQNNATNSIYLTSNPSAVACVNCISVEADVPNNYLIYTIERTRIITNTEIEGSQATINLVANVGHNIGWDDNITVTGSFIIIR